MAHSVKTEDCQLFQVLKDNRYVLLTMVSGMMMPSASIGLAGRFTWAGPIHIFMDEAGSLRVAAIDDEGREAAATIIGDWPLVL